MKRIFANYKNTQVNKYAAATTTPPEHKIQVTSAVKAKNKRTKFKRSKHSEGMFIILVNAEMNVRIEA